MERGMHTNVRSANARGPGEEHRNEYPLALRPSLGPSNFPVVGTAELRGSSRCLRSRLERRATRRSKGTTWSRTLPTGSSAARTRANAAPVTTPRRSAGQPHAQRGCATRRRS